MKGLTPETLVEYALEQDVYLTEREAADAYNDWKRTHAADALTFERAHRLIDREHLDFRCSWPHCGSLDVVVRYLRGSTELTRAQDASFCDQHLTDFCRALDNVRGTIDEDE